MEMMQQASTYSDQVQEADSISDNPEQFLRLDSLLFSIASIRWYDPRWGGLIPSAEEEMRQNPPLRLSKRVIKQQ